MLGISQYLFLSGLLLLHLLHAQAAHAHCGSFGNNSIPGINSSWIDLTSEQASFEFGDLRGNWFALTPAAEYAPLTWFSLAGRIPVVQLGFTENEDHKFGIGDLEVATRFQIAHPNNQGFGLVTGASLESPTGDVDAGLGGDHYALTPFVEGAFPITENLHLFVVARYSEGLTEGHHAFTQVHGALISPHSARETAGRIGMTWERKFGFVRGSGEAVYGIDHPTETGPILAHLDLGIRLDDELTLVAGSSLPIAGKTSLPLANASRTALRIQRSQQHRNRRTKLRLRSLEGAHEGFL